MVMCIKDLVKEWRDTAEYYRKCEKELYEKDIMISSVQCRTRAETWDAAADSLEDFLYEVEV